MALTLEELYEMQKELDARIIKEKGLEGQDLLPNTVLGLQVEIGELANEWRGFKHWSNDREPRYEKKTIAFADPGGPFEHVTHPLLEEYADCLHFFLSIAQQMKIEYIPNYEPRLIEENTTEQLISLLVSVGTILDAEEDMTYLEKWEMSFLSFIDLGHSLGFSFEHIAEAYAAKNAVNYERQSNGY